MSQSAKHVIDKATQHGAKFHQHENGMWTVLDQPNTPLWYAWFLDEGSAAISYCLQHNLLTGPNP